VRILKEVSHPNIVRLIEVFYHYQNLYIAMECMVCDLAKLIDDPKVVMTETDIAIIFQQILLGVEHLHKQWVLHRVVAAHPGHQAAERPRRPRWQLQAHRLRPRALPRPARHRDDQGSRHSLVQAP
jgi:hypothetical protein